MATKIESFFTGTVRVMADGRVVWAFNNKVWPVLSQHKAKARRRLSRGGAIYCTPAGVAGGK